jgi:cytochrome c-type biogenesis protein CcmH/NrfF
MKLILLLITASQIISLTLPKRPYEAEASMIFTDTLIPPVLSTNSKPPQNLLAEQIPVAVSSKKRCNDCPGMSTIDSNGKMLHPMNMGVVTITEPEKNSVSNSTELI